MSPNASGANQFGGHALRYGEKQKLAELERVAPAPGAEMVAHATNTPRRSQKRAERGQQAPEPTQEQLAQASTEPPLQPDYKAQLAAAWQQIGATPGADDLVREYAAEAQAQIGAR